MPRLSRIPWSRRLMAALTVLSVSLAPCATHPISAEGLHASADPAIMILLTFEQALLDLTNADRVAYGLPPLDFDADTLAIARARAAGQLGTPSLSHYDRNGDLAFVNLLAGAHLGYQLAGENLARSTASDAAVTRRVQTALMQSPTHRKNILEQAFGKVAIGAATDAQGDIAFAEIFRSAN